MAATMMLLCSCERTLPGTNMKTAYGIVDGKEIIPGYFITIDDSQTLDFGEITIVIPASHQEWVPEKYKVFVVYRNEQDEKQRAFFYVSKFEYECFLFQEEVEVNADGTVRKMSDIIAQNR